MPHLIVSTCGTSLLTADATSEVRKLMTDHANARDASDVPAAVRHHVAARLETFARAGDLASLRAQSAELAGLIAFYGGKTLQGKDHHVLVATDTFMGEQGAQAIRAVLERHGHSAEVKRCSDLRTDDLGAYRAALSSLVAWAYDTIPGYKSSSYRVVFNLTGGFKAVQGFMQTLGALLADECVYVFERSDELIRLPRLPIQMEPEPWVSEHLGAFRRMAIGLSVSPDQVRGIPEVLLFSVDGGTALSEWGEMVWREIKPAIYARQIHPCISDRLRWGDGFVHSLRGLEPGRMVRINEKMDDLARFLETGQNIASLDFKAVKGPARQGSTWEMDAWHDGAAKRLFGHFHPEKKDLFVLDRLDHALH